MFEFFPRDESVAKMCKAEIDHHSCFRLNELSLQWAKVLGRHRAATAGLDFWVGEYLISFDTHLLCLFFFAFVACCFPYVALFESHKKNSL